MAKKTAAESPTYNYFLGNKHCRASAPTLAEARELFEIACKTSQAERIGILEALTKNLGPLVGQVEKIASMIANRK